MMVELVCEAWLGIPRIVATPGLSKPADYEQWSSRVLGKTSQTTSLHSATSTGYLRRLSGWIKTASRTWNGGKRSATVTRRTWRGALRLPICSKVDSLWSVTRESSHRAHEGPQGAQASHFRPGRDDQPLRAGHNHSCAKHVLQST